MKEIEVQSSLQSGDFLSDFEKSQFNKPLGAITYRQCYVAFLDLLGFRALMIDHGDQFPALMFQIWQDCVQTTSSLYKEVDFKIMSDSILVWTHRDEDAHFWTLANVVELIRNSFLKKSIFLRGAITKGSFFIHEDIIVSPAMSRAYELESKVAKVPRIVIDKGIVTQAISKLEKSNGVSFLRVCNHLLKCCDFKFKQDFDEEMILDPFSGFEGYIEFRTSKPSWFCPGDQKFDSAIVTELSQKYLNHLIAELKLLTSRYKLSKDFSVREKYNYVIEKIREELAIAAPNF